MCGMENWWNAYFDNKMIHDVENIWFTISVQCTIGHDDLEDGIL